MKVTTLQADDWLQKRGCTNSLFRSLKMLKCNEWLYRFAHGKQKTRWTVMQILRTTIVTDFSLSS